MRYRVYSMLALAVALVFTAGLCLEGCSKASQPYQSGRLYFSQKLYDKAAEQFELAVKEEPNNGKNHFELAKTYAELERNEDAGKEFQIAGEKDPSLKKEIDDAIQHYRADHFNDALSLMKDKSWGEAIAELQESIYLRPDEPNQYINMGYCYSELGETDLAVSYYEKAMQLSPQDEKARTNLIATFVKQASDFREQGEYAQAIKFYQKVLQLYLKDESLDVSQTPGSQLAGKTKGDEAGTGYLFDLGLTYMDMGEKGSVKEATERAADIFNGIFGANPADNDALYNYGYCEMLLGDYAEAISTFGKLLDRKPKEASYYMLMATCYVRTGATDKETQTNIVLYFAIANSLQSESNRMNPADYKDRSKHENFLKNKYRTWNDMKQTLDSFGTPEDIYTYTDESGHKFETWFYWTRGEAIVFNDGSQYGKINFAPKESGID
jgi:tetratricopeptide (TPR) repeat protein